MYLYYVNHYSDQPAASYEDHKFSTKNSYQFQTSTHKGHFPDGFSVEETIILAGGVALAATGSPSV